ncbi:MAG: ATP-dependent Clp protease ATP-binding subunit ClpA, partial [Proteobacteria bacterium]
MFSTELGFTLEAAFREALNRRHRYFCIEHVLYAFCFDDGIIEVLTNTSVDIHGLKRDLENFFDREVEKFPLNSSEDEKPEEPMQTPALRRVLQRALLHMHSARKDIVSAKDVLVAMFSEEDSHAVFAMKRQGLSRLDLLNYIAHGVSKTSPYSLVGSESSLVPQHSEEEESTAEEEGEEVKPSGKKVLQYFTEDLTAKAADGELDPVIGREQE